MKSRLLGLSAIAARRMWRLAIRLTTMLLLLCLAIIVGFTLYAVNALPPLQPWHTEHLHEEFSATKHGTIDFEGYLRREDKLFDELHNKTAEWDTKNDAYIHSRFNPASPFHRLANGAPFNRSFTLSHPKPVGHALLIHGLTDSPYSMKALAEALHARAFEVTVLRLPGHGTLPSMMTEMRLRDWTAAVRIAARHVASRTPASQLFYIGGYSSGGTLALQYTLDSLGDESLRKPDRVLLVSPAIKLTKVAALANILDLLGVVPIPALDKVHWQAIVAEYDPYKFNSFPVNATRQINRATKALQRALADASDSGLIARMPPVITWQSVVDSTVGADGATDILYPHLDGPQHRLVLFDVNRHQGLSSVQRPESKALIDALSQGARGYTLDVVANVNPESRQVSINRLNPEGETSSIETALNWPDHIVSVGHVALPFPPGDPVYGFMPGSGRDGIPSIGSWLLRGEDGAIAISLGALNRLRSNPFWPLIDADVGEIVASDLEKQKH